MSVSDLIIDKYSKDIKSNLTILKSSNSGVSADAFFDLLELTQINKNHLAKNIFSLSLKTINRYKKDGKSLSPRVSETALKLVRLFKNGKVTFGEVGYFIAWINKASFGLGGALPLEMMTTHTGINLIEKELIKIEFGSFA